MKSFLFVFSWFLLTFSAMAEGRADPQAEINSFFKNLGETGGAMALKELCKGTLLEAQKGMLLEGNAGQLDAVIKVYGKIVRVENVEKKPFGQSFIRFRLISYHSTGAPVFWEFMFLRVQEDWQVYTFRFNDQMYRAFSETQ